jgi:hypothetical protein
VRFTEVEGAIVSRLVKGGGGFNGWDLKGRWG